MAAADIALPESRQVGRLEVFDADEFRVVTVNGHRAAQFRRDDRLAERVIMTQLAEACELKGRDIAEAFGIHPVSLSRFVGQARHGGAAALLPSKPGPRRPSKLSPQMKARILKLHEEGLSLRTIAQRVSNSRRKLSYGSVARVLREQRVQPKAIALELEPAVELPAEPEPVEGFSLDESRTSRYAGALMLFASLARLDLWSVLQAFGAQVGPSRSFGLMQTVAATVFCFALRFRSIEDSKNIQRKDFGVLLGTKQGPTVQTLRLKLSQLSESLEPMSLNRELLQRYVSLEPVWEGMYYVDGHFCPYYGQHATPRGWHPQRRLAAPGHTDVYVHDVRGRVLFFISQPLNDSLARAMPQLVAEIRQVHGERPFTVVFDRGGYSGKLFRWLSEKNIGFITYLKGRKAKRRYSEDRFKRSWFKFEKRRHVYRVYEKKTRVNEVGLLRTVVYQDDTGKQIPVLSNLPRKCSAAKLVHCLRLRWRQENAFKYLKEHYAIEQIIEYGAEEEQRQHQVANPKRKKLKSRISETEKEIEALEAQLGRALEHSANRTTKGLKISQARLRQQLAAKRQSTHRLQTRLNHTPSKIALSELKDKGRRELLTEDRRLIVNAIKLSAYNAERLLAVQFNHHYGQDKDVLSIFRSLFHLPGQVIAVSRDMFEVRLERPKPEKVARALESLVEELNQQSPRMFIDGPLLDFHVSH